jgi:hypothetical protein
LRFRHVVDEILARRVGLEDKVAELAVDSHSDAVGYGFPGGVNDEDVLLLRRGIPAPPREVYPDRIGLLRHLHACPMIAPSHRPARWGYAVRHVLRNQRGAGAESEPKQQTCPERSRLDNAHGEPSQSFQDVAILLP